MFSERNEETSVGPLLGRSMWYTFTMIVMFQIEKMQLYSIEITIFREKSYDKHYHKIFDRAARGFQAGQTIPMSRGFALVSEAFTNRS